MNSDMEASENDARRLRHAFYLSMLFTCLLWAIKLVEISFNLDFVKFGILPHRADGLTGILLAPLVHSSLSHLFVNTVPLIILSTILLYGYPRSAKIVFPVIYLGTGLGVWLFGRSAYHIGASGLTFGLMFFIFISGALRWDTRAIVLSMIVFFLYGSMIWGIFPTKPEISFESHLFGAFIGLLMAFILRHYDPLPLEKKYSWEEDDNNCSEE